MNFDAVKNKLIEYAEAAGLTEYEVFFMENEGISRCSYMRRKRSLDVMLMGCLAPFGNWFFNDE